MKNTRYFVLGATGFLGSNLISLLTEKGFSVTGVSRDGSEKAHINFEKWESEIQRHQDQHGIVINCVAMTDLAQCEKNRDLASYVNTELPLKFATLCKQSKTGFVQIGTDSVFPNSSQIQSPRYWKIGETGTPANFYAHTKLQAEAELKKINWGYCLRFSFIGPSYGTSRGLVAFLGRSLLTPGLPIHGIVDNWFSPISTQFLVENINLEFLEKARGGFLVEQWGSHPAMTKYDFLERTARLAGFQPQMVKKLRNDILGGVPAPLDQSVHADIQESAVHLLETAALNLKQEIALIESSHPRK